MMRNLLWFRAGVLAMVMVVLGGMPVIARDAENRLLNAPSLTTTAVTFDGATASDGVGPYQVQLLAADARGLVLELRTPDVQSSAAPGDACDVLTIPGYGYTTAAGAPELPVIGALLGIPATGDVALELLHVESRDLPGAFNVCPVRTPVVDAAMPDPDMEIAAPTVYARLQDRAVYGRSVLFPENIAEILSTGFIRSQRVATLRFNPVQVNPVTGQVRLHTVIRARLAFAAPIFNVAATEDLTEDLDEGSFEPILRGSLLNYAEARSWRVPSTFRSTGQMQLTSVVPPRYRIVVKENGLYRITFAMLQAADPEFDFSDVDPRNMHLTYRGQEVAMYIEGEADGSFDPGDSIFFYGEALDTVYTNENVYWLTWDDLPGLRMAILDGQPGSGNPVPLHFSTTLHLEQNTIYAPSSPDSDGDRWYWNFVNPTFPSRSYPFVLQHLATEPLTATVRGMLRSFAAEPQHIAEVLLNDTVIHTATWPAGQAYPFMVEIPHSLLLEGNNTLMVRRVVGPVTNIFYINWFDIDYHSRYIAQNNSLFFSGDASGVWEYRLGGFTAAPSAILEITDPLAPRRVLNAVITESGGVYTATFRHAIAQPRRYLALTADKVRAPHALVRDTLSNLRDTNNAADYIIITHKDFRSAIQPLAAYRAAQGLRVVVVDVQDVYDEFNHGIVDAEAIRNFLAYAYHSWQRPAPTFVLLVGDGNFDPKNYLGRGEMSYIPPYLGDVDPWMGETAADNRYVAVSGADIYPDMHLGRLTVKTAAETTIMVNKILAYEQSPPEGDWNQKLLFVADNADSGGNFPVFSDMVADYYVPVPYQVDKVYYGVNYSTGTAARAAIVAAINAGRLMVNYVGHAASGSWASSPVLFDRPLAAGLINGGKLPLMVPMACLEGYYISPSSATLDYSALAEVIVRNPNGGAIASFSPTGQGLASGHDIMNKALYEAIFFNDITQLGPATMMGKMALINMGHDYLIDTYLLFGDPATRLNTLPADVSVSKTVTPTAPVEPGAWITYTLTYTNTGPARANNVVLQDLLPAALLSPTVIFSGATITPRLGAPFTWDVAALPPNTGGVVTITARVSPNFTGFFTNTATISTSARETDTDNNTSAPIVTEVLAPDLVMRKLGPTTTWPGETITYTLVYSNVGGALAPGVVITDILPAPLLTPTVTSFGPPIALRPGAAFVWDVADLPPGARGVITISAVVSPTFEGTLSNQAVIATSGPEVNTADNTDTLNTGVRVADLSITKTGPTTLLPGDTFTYVLSFANNGNAAATGVVITDTLPAGLTNVSVLSTGAAITPRPGSAYVWDVEDLPPGAGGVITITATVDESYRGTLENQAFIAAEVPEIQLGNNASARVMTVVAIADVAITKTGPATVIAGERITYTLAFANVDTALATGVVITDTLPAGLLGVEVVASMPGITARPGTAFVWEVPDLPAGAGGVLTVTAQVAPTYRGALLNQAQIATAAPEASTANNASALITTEVLVPDVRITKTGPTEAHSGDTIAYVLSFANVGTGLAREVVITDLLPAPLQNATYAASGVALTLRPGTTFVWDVGELAPGASGVITITATVNASFAGSLTNTAAIATSSVDDDPSNNVDQAVTQVRAPDVVIQKTGPTAALSGDTLLYTLTYANIGDALAASVVITDLLPTQLQGAAYIASNPGVALRPGTTFVWDVGELAPGASGVITITAQIPATFAGTLTNTARIATAGVEVNLANNVSAPVATQVQLRERKVYLPLVMRAP